ncbi:small neutral amino acid transporter SnatA (MarC family) [Erwinia rhapontici]|nr:small neutral amino acid transporter SnatA (MarC family) [Erwinia rhapontici]
MNLLIEISKAISLGLLLLLPLANPLTTVALFIGLTGKFTNTQRQWVSIRTSIYVFMIMIITFYAGQAIMDAFGISLPGLRIAGGMIVMFIGFRMLFPSGGDSKFDLLPVD